MLERLRQMQGERSQQEFAADLGISQASLSRILSGTMAIGVDTARAILRRHPELNYELSTFMFFPPAEEEQAS